MRIVGFLFFCLLCLSTQAQSIDSLLKDSIIIEYAKIDMELMKNYKSLGITSQESADSLKMAIKDAAGDKSKTVAMTSHLQKMGLDMGLLQKKYQLLDQIKKRYPDLDPYTLSEAKNKLWKQFQSAP
jgi:hypothetical protein